MVYDVFTALDVTRTGKITRADYAAALKEQPTVEKIKVLRRSGMEGRMRRSSQSVELDEFIKMLWPSVTEKEIAKIHRWAQLRDAWHTVAHGAFRGEDKELRKAFNHLLMDGDPKLPVGQLWRAHILSKYEILQVLHTEDDNHKVTYEDFRVLALPYLQAKYITAETKRKMKAEEEAKDAQTFETTFRSMIAK